MRRFLLSTVVLAGLLPGCGAPDVSSPEDGAPAHLPALSQSGANTAPDTSTPMAGMGIMVGEVTPHAALVQVRLTQSDQLVEGDVPGAAGVVEFVLAATDGAEPAMATTLELQVVAATADRDYIARAKFDNLTPGTAYTCQTRIGVNADALRPGPHATFKTLPGPARAEAVRFVVVTGMNYAKFHGDRRIDRAIHLIQNNTDLPQPYDGPDKDLGYPALATILKLRPDFFVGTGDNVYYDTPKEPRAETVRELRQKWHEQFVQPRYIDLFAAVPTYWEIDDHDYRIDDGDNSGGYDPSPEVARRLMLEQLPYMAFHETAAKTYRTHRVTRDLQIWLVENRVYRSDNALPDGAQKSIWGGEQKAWLKRTLQESDATFKVLISPNPMIGPDDRRKFDNHTNMGGFQHERDEFFDWLNESGLAGKNFYIVCGDRHWQYHSIHPKGLEEFSCGALVDANSRLGRRPGDPQSTDPGGLIKQPYAQEVRSAGFLLVKTTPAGAELPAKLAFIFHDEHGEVLYEHVKNGVKP